MRRFIRARAARRCRTCARYSSTNDRLRDAGVYFGTATGDLQIPRLCSAGLGSYVETADQFERESGTLLNGKTKDLGEHVGGGHRFSLTASRRVRAPVIRQTRVPPHRVDDRQRRCSDPCNSPRREAFQIVEPAQGRAIGPVSQEEQLSPPFGVVAEEGIEPPRSRDASPSS